MSKDDVAAWLQAATDRVMKSLEDGPQSRPIFCHPKHLKLWQNGPATDPPTRAEMREEAKE